MNKARITYRIQPNRRNEPKSNVTQEEHTQTRSMNIIPLYEDEFERVDTTEESAEKEEKVESAQETPALNDFFTDYTNWSSPFDAETQRVEQIIRETDRWGRVEPQQAPHSDSESLIDDGNLVYEPPNRAYGDGYYYKTRPPWFKIISSISGAIITGVLFGFFVLNLFSAHSDSIKTAVNSIVGNVATQSKAAQSNQVIPITSSGTIASSTASSNLSTFTVPSMTFSLLQAGAFSNQNTADDTVNQLKKKGLAAVAEHLDKYYVYVGVANNSNDVLPVSQLLQDRKIDIYIKDFILPQLNNNHWNGVQQEDAQQYFTKGYALVKAINEIAVQKLGENKLTSIDPTMLQNITTIHQDWTRIAVKMQKGVIGQQANLLQQLDRAMNTAVLSMEEYDKNPSSAYLWQSQTAMMNYLLSEKQLISTLSP